MEDHGYVARKRPIRAAHQHLQNQLRGSSIGSRLPKPRTSRILRARGVRLRTTSIPPRSLAQLTPTSQGMNARRIDELDRRQYPQRPLCPGLLHSHDRRYRRRHLDVQVTPHTDAGSQQAILDTTVTDNLDSKWSRLRYRSSSVGRHDAAFFGATPGRQISQATVPLQARERRRRVVLERALGVPSATEPAV